ASARTTGKQIDAQTRRPFRTAPVSSRAGRSEVELEAGVEGPLARELRIERQRVQFVILVRDVQHADARLGMATPEAIAGKEIELPEFISGQRARVAAI